MFDRVSGFCVFLQIVFFRFVTPARKRNRMQRVKHSHLGRNSRLVPSAPIPIVKSIGDRSGFEFMRSSADSVFSCCDPGSEAEANNAKKKSSLVVCACHGLLTQKGVLMWCVAVTIW